MVDSALRDATYDESFVQDVMRELKTIMQQEYDMDVDPQVQIVHKTNVDRVGIVVRGEGIDASPTMYIEEAYEAFKIGTMVISEIARQFADTTYRFIHQAPELPDLTPEEAKQHITLTLINTAMNQELLSKTPHFEILGGELSAIPRWYIDEGASFVVSNDLCKSLMLTPDEVLQIGQEHINSQRFEAKSMQQVMAEMMGEDFMDMMPMEEGPQMIVLTSENRIQGSNALLSERALEQVREMLDSDFAILPSSINETLCIPITEDLRPDDLRSMVNEVNMTQVAPEERLSDEVFMYRDQRLTIVGDDFEMDGQEIDAPRMESQKMRFAM